MSSPAEPEKLRRPERVKSPEFSRMLLLSRQHPCPNCRGIRVYCGTCHGTRVDPAYAVWEDPPE